MNEKDFDRIQKTIETATSGLGKILDGFGEAMSDVADAVNDISQSVNAKKTDSTRPRADDVRSKIYESRDGDYARAGRFQDKVVHREENGTVYHGTVEPASGSLPAVKPKLYLAPSGQTAKGVAKTVFGGVLTAVGAGVLGAAIITSAVPLLLGGGLLIAGGVPIGIGGSVEMSRAKRFKLYVQALGNKTLMNLSTLASSTGKSMDYLRKDLKKMSDRRMFTQAHFDEEEEIFMISDETYRDYRNLLENQKAAAEEQERKDRELKDAGLSSAGIEIVKQGRSYIEKIQKINAELPDPVITEKLSRLEQVIRRILDEVRKKPSSATELRRLMNYYLPTTWKLLTTYKEIEDEPVKTEQMEDTKKEIEDTLDTINSAFEKLLNQLFQTKAWDVSADISVLNTMLTSEGLTDDGIGSFVKEES